MKRLVLLAGATLVMSSAAQAQDSEIKHDGEFRVRYFNDMSPTLIKDGAGNKSDIEGRTKLGLTLRKGENLQAHVTFLHGTKFGAGNTATTLAEAGHNTVDNNNSVLVNEAYGWWKAGEGMSLKAGRFNVNIGGGEFFSSDDWMTVPHTHEGFQLAFDTGFASMNAYLLDDKQLTKPTTSSFDSDPEQHTIVLSGDLKNMPEIFKTTNLTLVNIARSEVATDGTQTARGSANMQHVGLTLGGDASGFMWKVFGAMQMGVFSKTAALEQKAAGSMFDVTVGYGLPETMGLKFFARFHSDSGDDSATDDKNNEYVPLYYDSHKLGGRMDLFGFGNLTFWNVGASVAPSDDLEVGLGVFGFTKSKENGSVNTNSPGTYRGTFTGLANKSDLGMELDVYATKKYGPAFAIDAHLGAFMPGSAFKDATVKKEATYMQLMLAGTMMF